MRKVFILICTLMIPLIGISQKYTPVNLSNGEWTCGFNTKGGFFDFYLIDGKYGADYVTEKVKFYGNGDTLINDTLYKKLYYIGYAKPTTTPQRNISGYYGAIRNDTINKRVWLNNNIKYGILYDFNLKIGDAYGYSCSEPEATINSIDSVLYCDIYHKRYNYKDAQNYNQYIIEGIGSSEGLIPVNCLTSFSYLICYSEKNNVCDTCKTPTAIKEIPINHLNVFPNPTKNCINISSETTLFSIEIIDLTGRFIYSNHNILSNKIQIEMQTSGVYILKVRTNEETIVRKLVKE